MRRAARVDQTAAALVKHARALGCRLWLPGIDVDRLLLFRGAIYMVDWKSPGGRMTASQRRLVDEGWPLHFIQTPADLEQLLLRKVLK